MIKTSEGPMYLNSSVLLPQHAPPYLFPPFTMSSHEDPNLPSDGNPISYDGGSEFPVTRQLGPAARSWPQTAAAGGYSQPNQSLDPVGNLLKVHDAEVQSCHTFDDVLLQTEDCYLLSHPQDMDLATNFPGSGYAIPIPTASQGPGVGTGATYINDDVPCTFVNPSFSSYPDFNYEEPQHLHGYAHYDQVHDLSARPFLHDVPQHLTQGIHISQTSQGPFPLVHPTPSPHILSLSHGVPVCRTDTTSAGPSLALGSLTLDGANTARITAGAEPHSHPSPVATSSANQSSGSSSIRQSPSSPERKRLLPLTADETARRVMPRHAGASNVHSAYSAAHRRSHSNPDVHDRGAWIPQERYTTSSITSYNTPDQHPGITFNLENPDQIGIPIMDILEKTHVFARLRDRTQTFEMGKKTFTLRVQWPGYRPWSKTIAALDWTKSRGPVTRLKLADAVATGIRDLFEKYRNEPYDPDYAAWNVGPNGIQLDQICLVALHQMSRGSWQPALCLLTPSG